VLIHATGVAAHLAVINQAGLSAGVLARFICDCRADLPEAIAGRYGDTMPSSSSSVPQHVYYVGKTGLSPTVMATFRVGDNSANNKSWHEFQIANGEGANPVYGFLTWDPIHANTALAPFFSMAMVNLVVTQELCQWSVGTSDFVEFAPEPYTFIKKVQVVARAGSNAANRLIQWDLIEVTFIDQDGNSETYPSNCLPRAGNAEKSRRGAFAEESLENQPRQTFSEINTGSESIVSVRIRGVVTLRANHCGIPAELGPDDLQGQVLVFTDLSPDDDDDELE
jgi:hypothetical protein